MPKLIHDFSQLGQLQLTVYVRAHKFDAQPSCWRNFVLSIHPHTLSHAETMAAIQSLLAQFDATFESKHVQFTNSDLMWQWIITYA
jgi:hypothetical protein